MHIDAGKFDAIKKQYSNDDIVSLGIMMFEFVESFMYVHGKIENMIEIIDCSNINVLTAPYAMLKALMTAIQMLHKCKSRQIIVLNAPKTITIIWNVVKQYLDEVTRNKVSIFHTGISPDLMNLCDER